MKLKDCSTIIAGQSPESKYYNTEGIGIPFFQGKADFGELYPSIRTYCSQPTKIAEKDDILLSVRAPVGPTNLAPCKACIGRGLTAIRPSDGLDLKYLLYFFRYFEAQLQQKGTGTTFKAITQDIIKNLDVPVPSLSEQKRIVASIEDLFSQLDNGVETLKKAKQQLAVYRQAVLKEAFKGIPFSIKVSDICSVVRGGSPRPAGDEKYYNGNIPFLKVADITNSKGMYLTKFTYSIKEAGLSKTRMVPADTLMLSNSGATLGVPKICTFETTFNDGIAAFIDFKRDVHLPFHYYFWLSKTEELRAINQGAAQPNLNTSIIGNILVPDLSLEKQIEIAQEVETRLSACESIEQTIDTALQQAEALRQSILKKAFEGGLI